MTDQLTDDAIIIVADFIKIQMLGYGLTIDHQTAVDLSSAMHECFLRAAATREPMMSPEKIATNFRRLFLRHVANNYYGKFAHVISVFIEASPLRSDVVIATSDECEGT